MDILTIILAAIAAGLAPGAAMYIFVALKAFQQRNVAFDVPWYYIMAASYGMVFAEVYVIAVIVDVGYHLPTILSIGTGSGTGTISAMALHRRVFGNQGRD
jgi:hypothetical protein